jgi:precorrin-2 dehydrogenase / sirohydrochlorin ferrochelatase
VSGLPILVEARGLRVLVVGGGAVAARRLALLVDAGARARVVAPRAGEAIRSLAAAGRIEWREVAYRTGDIGDAQLVVAATDDRAVNAAVAADAQRRSRLVNVVDAPEAGSFAMMATHRSGGLVLGVSADGVPGAAARIRDAIALRFDGRYARALDGLARMRRALLGEDKRQEWRTIAAAVIDRDFCESVEQGTLDERVASWR